MADPFKYFRIEARELVDALARDVLALEKGGGADAVARILRAAHTLKGAARIVKHRALAERSHELESVLAGGDPGSYVAVRTLVEAMEAEVVAMTAPGVSKPAETSIPAASRPGASLSPSSASPVSAGSTVRDTDALDEVLDGLAEVHARLAKLREASADDLPARIDQLERELRTVRGDAERLRLVAARTLWTALERTARDAAAASGAAVEVITEGGDVRVDAAVLGALQPALVQLVRNAVAHGRATRVHITARQLESRVCVSVADNGRGIDLGAVRAALERRGTRLATDASAEDIIRELLRGGVSTSATVTEVAGRGIGLDVVRDTAQRLGGEVTATTRAGEGATFALTVPVSLQAISVVTVAAGTGRAAIPRDAVRATRVHRDADLVHRGGARGLALDGVLLPYAPIGDVLGDSSTGPPRSVVIVAHASGDVALGVDRVLGVDDVIARARPRAAPIRRIVSALTVDHEARPTPILDPGELAARIRAVAAAPAPVADPERPARPPILVVDDSLTTRMLEQSILESAGYTVELAASAEEALDKVMRTRYALVLVDVEMPGMDGFRFVAELRARPQLAAIPAILVTSRNAAEDRRRGEAAGAQDYIVKGEFDQAFLLRRIRELVG